MKISALRRLTLLDFPGKTAAIAFLPGCNFRCHYCHNSEFVLPEKLAKISADFIPENVFFNFLDSRKKLLDGVVISGGEPTIHADLPDFLRKIRARGFQIKLDSNGTNPKMIAELLSENVVDYFAIDIKSSPKKYSDFCGVKTDFSKIEKTKKLLENSKIDFEFRTTLVREFHDAAEFLEILKFIKGVPKYFLQNFQNRGGTLNPKWQKFSGFSEKELLEKQKIAKKFVGFCGIRN